MPKSKNELNFITEIFEIREEQIFIEDLNEYDRFVDRQEKILQG